MQTHLNLIITHRCNFCCKHCYQSCPDAEDSDYADVCTVLDIAKNSGIRSITVTGGECTLHNEFENILSRIKEMGFELGVFTNGYNLERKVIDSVDRLFLSLDGPRETHDLVRGHVGSYDRIIRIMDYCSEIERRVSVQITVTTINSKNIVELIPQLKSYSDIIDTIFIAVASREGRALENNIVLEDPLCIRPLKKQMQEQLGFQVMVKDNVYRRMYLRCSVDPETQFDLWADAVDMSCYISNSFEKIAVYDFSESWYLDACRRLSNSLLEYSDYDSIVIDDLLLRIGDYAQID